MPSAPKTKTQVPTTGSSPTLGEPASDKGGALSSQVVKALSHPMRLSILSAATVEGTISPSDFARSHDLSVGMVSHHFRALVKHGALELVEEVKVRGSIKHIYRATRRAIFGKADWPQVADLLKGPLVGAALYDFTQIASASIEAGTFQARDDFVFTWEPVTLDELGWLALARKFSQTWAWVQSVQEESAVRLEKTGEEGLTAVSALAIFETPKNLRSEKQAP
jgi:DNA-binding transcriptional ArsR family regulator